MSLCRRLTRVCAWLLAFVCFASVVHAQPPVAVSVRSSEGTSTEALRTRVAHELQARGFSVVTAEADRVASVPSSGASPESGSGQPEVAVSIEIAASGHTRIDVVRSDTKTRWHRIVDADDGRHVPSTIALAAAELVEATLLEPVDAHPPTIEPPAPSVSSRDAVEPPGVRADAHVGMLWPVRTRLPIAAATVAIGLRPTSRLGISTEATVPFHALDERVELARLRTYPFAIGVRTEVDVLPTGSRVRLDVQTGVSAIGLRVEVDPSAGATGHPRTLWTTGASAGLHLHGPVTERLHLGAVARVIAPFEHITLWAGETPAQRLGPVWIGAGASFLAQW